MTRRVLAPLLLLVTLGVVTNGCKAADAGKAWRLSFAALGPVKIGMTVPMAERALNTKLTAIGSMAAGWKTDPPMDPADIDDDCYYVAAETLPGLSFMVVGKKIARIDVTKGGYETERRARIGTTEAELRRLYPHVEVTPHQYDEAGHYFLLTSTDRKYGIVFETDGKVVTNFQCGELEPVQYVEGCL